MVGFGKVYPSYVSFSLLVIFLAILPLNFYQNLHGFRFYSSVLVDMCATFYSLYVYGGVLALNDPVKLILVVFVPK